MASHLTTKEIHELNYGMKLDHRRDSGKWYPSIIIKKEQNKLLIAYENDEKDYLKWNNINDENQLQRFAKYKSISRLKSNHSQHLKPLNIGDKIDINPPIFIPFVNKNGVGWRQGTVYQLDNGKSSQIQCIIDSLSDNNI